MNAPIKCVLEHFLPRWVSILVPTGWRIRPQIHLVASFWMGHHGQMTTISRTDAGKSSNTSVWIHGVQLGLFSIVVDVSEPNTVVLLEFFVNGVLSEGKSALSMSDPHTKNRSFHVFKHDGFRFFYLDGRPTTFESLGHVVFKQHVRFVVFGSDLFVTNPPNQAHKLATVANTQTESVRSRKEMFELVLDSVVEEDTRCPTFGWSQNI